MSSKEIAIKVKNISKYYEVYENPKDRLKQFLYKDKQWYKEFKALKNVSFEVPKGSTVGILGKNGSGKSTILQIIAGTLAPTAGNVQVNGKIVALLELGSGFNPEFTGRENVLLNATIFGIQMKEMDEKYKEIVEFADIGDYIDQPVKTYSSGMFARLAFAVAINMEPDILIVDEILAVGDISFQAKCVSKLRRMKDEGLTLLFVSHSVDAMKSLCNTAILLERGTLIEVGTAEAVSNKYLASVREDVNKSNTIEEEDVVESKCEKNDCEEETVQKKEDNIEDIGAFKYGKGEVYFKEVKMVNSEEEDAKGFIFGEKATLKCTIKSNGNYENVNISFLVRDITGIDLFGTTLFDEKIDLIHMNQDDEKTVNFSFPVNLRSGSYSISIAVNSVSSRDYSDVYLFQQIDGATAFEVVRDLNRPVHYKFHLPVDVGVGGLEIE